jgi:hypothetical protein
VSSRLDLFDQPMSEPHWDLFTDGSSFTDGQMKDGPNVQ